MIYRKKEAPKEQDSEIAVSSMIHIWVYLLQWEGQHYFILFILLLFISFIYIYIYIPHVIRGQHKSCIQWWGKEQLRYGMRNKTALKNKSSFIKWILKKFPLHTSNTPNKSAVFRIPFPVYSSLKCIALFSTSPITTLFILYYIILYYIILYYIILYYIILYYLLLIIYKYIPINILKRDKDLRSNAPGFIVLLLLYYYIIILLLLLYYYYLIKPSFFVYNLFYFIYFLFYSFKLKMWHYNVLLQLYI